MKHLLEILDEKSKPKQNKNGWATLDSVLNGPSNKNFCVMSSKHIPSYKRVHVNISQWESGP